MRRRTDPILVICLLVIAATLLMIIDEHLRLSPANGPLYLYWK